MDHVQVPIARALNKLLEGETWARERLARFAAETVEFRAPPLPTLRFCIAEGGIAQPADAATPATLTLTIRPSAFFSLPRGMDHALREVDISGNERLAAEVLFLARHLRWDVEEALSRVFGDVLAHRMVGDAKHLAAAAADAGGRLAQALMEYAVEERAMVARREEHEELARGNARLRDAIERMEKRLERLADA